MDFNSIPGRFGPITSEDINSQSGNSGGGLLTHCHRGFLDNGLSPCRNQEAGVHGDRPLHGTPIEPHASETNLLRGGVQGTLVDIIVRFHFEEVDWPADLNLLLSSGSWWGELRGLSFK